MTAEASWPRVRYGDILTETEERAGDRTDLPVLSVTKSRGLMLASERFGKVMHGRELSRYRVARRGQIVADPMLLWDGAIGAQRVVEAGLVSPDYRVYAATSGVNPEFLAYLVRSPHVLPFYQGGARGTNVRRNRIARSDFLAIPIALPPVPEQQKIAAILSSVDEAIEATDAVIAQLQAVKKAMMADLLTKGLPGRHTEFRSTTLGEIPADWSVGTVEEFGVVDAGKAKDPRATGREYPYLRVANVFDGEIRTHDLLRMPFSPAEFARFELRPGDVLLNEGQSLELVGRCAMYRGEVQEPCGIQNALLRFRARATILPPFAEQYFRWCQHSGRFAEIATQTTSIAHLGLKRFAQMTMAVPSLGEQEAIVDLLESVDTRLRSETATVMQKATLKQALMSALLTGEIRVRPNATSEAAA